jgi:hypothetical protein
MPKRAGAWAGLNPEGTAAAPGTGNGTARPRLPEAHAPGSVWLGLDPAVIVGA